MFALVYCFYRDGVPLRQERMAMGGRLVASTQKGVDVLTLWPREFMYEASSMRPLARLYRPEYSGVYNTEYALRGLERTAPRGPWVTQRWMIRPTTYADIPRLLEQQS